MRTAVETLVDAAMAITGADAAAIWLAAKVPSRQLQALKLAATRNLQEDALTAPSAEIVKAVLAEGRCVDATQMGPFLAVLSLRLGSVEQPQGILQLHTRSHSHLSTEQRTRAQALAELGAVAIAAERTAAECAQLEARQTQFIHLTTHELRSPIAVAQTLVRNVVKGYAGALTDKQNHIFTRVSAQLDALEGLVNDLLDLAASTAASRSAEEGPVTINASLGRVALILQPRAEEKGIAFSYHACRKELVVWAAEEGLDRTLVNLVGNAVKYTPTGGQVTIEACIFDHEISVTITDTGIGIPADALPHLFEEFYRAPNARTANIIGTGLGLAIVKRLVERYGGGIEVESTVGQGTTFTLTFPAYTLRP